MNRVYFLENQGGQDVRDNVPLFKLIQELKIQEDEIYSDIELSRPELQAALNALQAGDWLLVRSIEDLADCEDDLGSVLETLSSKGIELSSCQEQYLAGNDYLKIWTDINHIVQSYKAKFRYSAYCQARAEGKVGRPSNNGQIARALKMLRANCLTVKEIEKITGVSKSTLYRHRGKDN